MSTLETTNLKAPLTDAKHYTIVEAVEKNGYAKYMSFCGRIQRVFCRVVKSLSADKYSFAEKIAQSQESEAMEERSTEFLANLFTFLLKIVLISFPDLLAHLKIKKLMDIECFLGMVY